MIAATKSKKSAQFLLNYGARLFVVSKARNFSFLYRVDGRGQGQFCWKKKADQKTNKQKVKEKKAVGVYQDDCHHSQGILLLFPLTLTHTLGSKAFIWPYFLFIGITALKELVIWFIYYWSFESCWITSYKDLSVVFLQVRVPLPYIYHEYLMEINSNPKRNFAILEQTLV